MKKFFLIVKITAMMGLLAVVILSIRYFKSDAFIERLETPGSGPAVFFGFEQRTLQWCPTNIKEIVVYKTTPQSDNQQIQITITNPKDLSRICKISIESTTIDLAGTPDEYDNIAAFQEAGKEEKFLKLNRRTKVYNFGGLPFQSKHLDKIFASLQ